MPSDCSQFCAACAADPSVVACERSDAGHFVLHGVPYEEMPITQRAAWDWLWRRLVSPPPGAQYAAIAPPSADQPPAPPPRRRNRPPTPRDYRRLKKLAPPPDPVS